MAAIPDAVGDRNVTQAYMAELDAIITGFAPVVAPKISEQAKNDTVRAVESEIARVVHDANEKFNTHVQEVKRLAEKLGNDFVEEKRRELEAKDTELKANDAIMARKNTELMDAQEKLKQFNGSRVESSRNEFKESVGTEKLTPKEWVFFISKMLIEFYVSATEPLATEYKKKIWLKWSGLALAIVLFLMTTVEMKAVNATLLAALEKEQLQNTALAKALEALREGIKFPHLEVGQPTGRRKIVHVPITLYCIRREVIQCGRVRMRRIRWIVDVYGFIMSTIVIVLFAVSFRFPSSLHIALYACTFSICMLLENCVRQFTKKETGAEGGGA